MKYKAKVKSFKKLMSEALDVDDKGNLVFAEHPHLFTAEQKEYCGKEIIVYKTLDKLYCYPEMLLSFLESWIETAIPIEENEVWRPEKDEGFYIVGSDGNIFTMINDKSTINFNNCYKTKEQAEYAIPCIRQYFGIVKWKIDNDTPAKGEKHNICNYYIFYGHNDWIVRKEDKGFSVSEIYFSTEEKAEQCLEWLKKEGLI